MDIGAVNGARFLPGQRAGHYESFFQRANHPSRPLAWWIRYTIFSPRVYDGAPPGRAGLCPIPQARPEGGVGELWAVFFDGETGDHVAVKREVPLDRARFDREGLGVRIDDAVLGPGRLSGAAASGGHRLAWDVRYRGEEAPLLLFPPALYETRLPRAKSLVGLPLAVHEGTVDVDGRVVDVGGWVGSQNHNWGSRHTDHYAWGQVAGFDAHPRTFLEIATARLKLGRVWTPFMTPAVLRHEGREHAANTLVALLRARGDFDYFTWRFRFETSAVRVTGRIAADRDAFVGLSYRNPPGGTKDCLNTKIASCALTLVHKTGARRGHVEELSAQRRAAFEILTDDRTHGVAIRA